MNKYNLSEVMGKTYLLPVGNSDRVIATLGHEITEKERNLMVLQPELLRQLKEVVNYISDENKKTEIVKLLNKI